MESVTLNSRGGRMFERTARRVAAHVLSAAGQRCLVVCESTETARAMMREIRGALAAMGADFWHQTQSSLRLREIGHKYDPSVEAVRFGGLTDGSRWDRVVFFGLRNGAHEDVAEAVETYTSRLDPDGHAIAIDCGEWLDPLVRESRNIDDGAVCTDKLRQGGAMRMRLFLDRVMEPRNTVAAEALGIAHGFRCVKCRELIGDADARPGQGRERYHATCWRVMQMRDLTPPERARVVRAYEALDEAERVTQPAERPRVGELVLCGGELWTVVRRRGHEAAIQFGDRERMVRATDCVLAGGQGGGLASGPALSPGIVPAGGGNPRPAPERGPHEPITAHTFPEDGAAPARSGMSWRKLTKLNAEELRLLGGALQAAPKREAMLSEVTRVPGVTEGGAIQFKIRYPDIIKPSILEALRGTGRAAMPKLASDSGDTQNMFDAYAARFSVAPAKLPSVAEPARPATEPKRSVLSHFGWHPSDFFAWARAPIQYPVVVGCDDHVLLEAFRAIADVAERSVSSGVATAAAHDTIGGLLIAFSYGGVVAVGVRQTALGALSRGPVFRASPETVLNLGKAPLTLDLARLHLITGPT